MDGFTHVDEEGRIRMVDVSDKAVSAREALAQGVVRMHSETLEAITQARVKKGNVLETARIAGIAAAKKTSDLIPLCHPLPVDHIQIDFFPDHTACAIRIEATVKVAARTGVEMEALTAVSVAALTIYDMCKSQDRAMAITDVCVLKKAGGRSGTFVRQSS